MSFGGGSLEYVELEVMADRAAASKEHRHFPGVRRMPTGWSKSDRGSWISSGVDPKLWEVFCAECGDTDGPAGSQSDVVGNLRGPYRHEHQARHVAQKHFEEN
jgi:hypothetical protein